MENQFTYKKLDIRDRFEYLLKSTRLNDQTLPDIKDSLSKMGKAIRIFTIFNVEDLNKLTSDYKDDLVEGNMAIYINAQDEPEKLFIWCHTDDKPHSWKEMVISCESEGSVGSGGGNIVITGAEIDDTTSSASKVFSSKKTEEKINLAIDSAISSMPTSNFTTVEKIKLSRIEENANYFEHPLNHSSTIITTTPERQFISQVEKQLYADKYTKAEVDNIIAGIATGMIWQVDQETFADVLTAYPTPENNWCVSTGEGVFLYNGTEWVKIGSGLTPLATSIINGLMSSSDKVKLDNIEAGANNYTHPGTHSANMIEQTNERKFVTTAQVEAINNIVSTIEGFLVNYRKKTDKILESDLDSAFLDKVANAGGTIVNDALTSLSQTYSSAKIEAKINAITGSMATKADVDALFI